MDLKKIFGKQIDKVEKKIKDEVADSAIEKVVKDISTKLNIKLSDDNLNKIVKTISSKIDDVNLDKITDIAEKEIKKLINK